MNSLYGSRYSILQQTGWTYDYLLWGIGWATMQKMLIDAPRYLYGDKAKKKTRLTESNKNDILRQINGLKR